MIGRRQFIKSVVGAGVATQLGLREGQELYAAVDELELVQFEGPDDATREMLESWETIYRRVTDDANRRFVDAIEAELWGAPR